MSMRRRFVAWAPGPKDPDTGKFSKRPIGADGWPQTGWQKDENLLTLEAAIARAEKFAQRGAGVGLAFHDAPIGTANGIAWYAAAVDLDHVVTGLERDESGKVTRYELTPYAQQIIEEMGAYTEISPSGRGLRVLGLTSVPIANRKEKIVMDGSEISRETFGRSGFVTLTGWSISGRLADVTEPMTGYAAEWGSKQAEKTADLGTKPFRRKVDNSALWETPAGMSETPEESEANSVGVMSLLEAIPANCGRDEWRDVLWSIMGLKWECGEALAREWSERAADQYPDAEDALDRTINSFDPARADAPGIGSLVKIAKRHGWNGVLPWWPAEVRRREQQADEGGGEGWELGKRDVLNAREFAKRHAHDLRYVHAEKIWFQWNGVRWERCAQGQQAELAKEFVDQLFAGLPACRAAYGDDEAKVKAYVRHCQYSANRKAIDNMLELAKSDKRLAVPDLTHFDADPWLFQAANGVIDLHTGKLLEPDPARLMSRSSPVAYIPSAECPTWLRYLNEVFPDDPETIETMQRWMGYTLCGDVSEEMLLVELGHGANGKSIREAVHRHIMGSYGKAVLSTVVTAGQDDDTSKPTPEIASLCGLRYASVNETQANAHLNEIAVKRVAGIEMISARNLYGKPFEFAPTAKCSIRTNHRPIVRGTDNGVWRRLMLVHYPRTFAEHEQDKTLRFKLVHEAEGILAWMVEGFRLWQRDGLKLSPAVRREMATYREESDVLGEFLEQYVFDLHGCTPENEMYTFHYRSWATEAGFKPVTKNTFTRQLKERGIGRGKLNHNRVYLGIRRRT